jgi:hypothetical protein
MIKDGFTDETCKHLGISKLNRFHLFNVFAGAKYCELNYCCSLTTIQPKSSIIG